MTERLFKQLEIGEGPKELGQLYSSSREMENISRVLSSGIFVTILTDRSMQDQFGYPNPFADGMTRNS